VPHTVAVAEVPTRTLARQLERELSHTEIIPIIEPRHLWQFNGLKVAFYAYGN
jgi:hypothetical protein